MDQRVIDVSLCWFKDLKDKIDLAQNKQTRNQKWNTVLIELNG